LDTLAAAYAEADKFELAIAAASRGIQLASEQDQTELATEIKARRELYRAGTAYHSR
jgi:hypothetical protein